MELYIRIVDGQPVDHPILGDNFRQAFPYIDTNNLPDNFARFVRVAKPSYDRVYQYISNEATYQWVDGVVMDVWENRDMTAEERAAKIAHAMQFQPYPSWTFSEETCNWNPPVPKPEDFGPEKMYYWDEPTLSWIAQTPVEEI